MKGRPKPKETLDRLAQRQAESSSRSALLIRRGGRLGEVVSSGRGIRGIEALEEGRCQEMAAFPKERPLIVGEGEHPRQSSGQFASRAAVTPSEVGGRESGAAQ